MTEALKPEPSSIRQQLNEEPVNRWITYWFILSFFNDFATSGHIVCVQDHQPSECCAHCVALCSHVMCVVFVFIAGSHWIDLKF